MGKITSVPMQICSDADVSSPTCRIYVPSHGTAKKWHCPEPFRIFVTERLAEEYQHCRVHRTEHGSDHRAIDTLYNIEAQRREQIEPRLLFKNAPWTEISDRVANELQGSPRPQDTQAQTDRLLNIVATAVKALTPTARPSPYAKRWWTQDLTRLRREYTNLRNRARAQRRGGRLNEALEAEAREAAREYHRTLRRQKKGRWEEFLPRSQTYGARPGSSRLGNRERSLRYPR
jgi:hypothetical protein